MMSTSRKLLIAVAMIVVIVALFLAWASRATPSKHSLAELSGTTPFIAKAQSERIPSVGIAKPIGWAAGATPAAAAGLVVTRFAEGLDHPRTLLTLPNGDVLVAETNAPAGKRAGGLTGMAMKLLMGRAGAGEASPNTIVLLRDADGDGKAEQRFVLRHADLASPAGMAWGKGKLYVANHNAVLAFDYTPGDTVLEGSPVKLMDLPPAGRHWMRILLLSPDGTKLFATVGSGSNIAENGIAAERARAAIWEIDLASGHSRQFAAGMRNPNGMGWNPSTGELWTVVNERDQLGPDVPPDYLTNVPVGAQYGWPWIYWKDQIDWRVRDPIPDDLMGYVRKPEYALGAHTAPLGLLFTSAGNRMGSAFGSGAFIARHGSWNRKPLAGYDVVFVKFDGNGNPQGLPVPVLSGFLAGDSQTHGRPVWLAWDKAGALLVTDDTAGIVWRVTAPGAGPNAAPKAVQVDHMPPTRELTGKSEATFKPDPAH